MATLGSLGTVIYVLAAIAAGWNTNAEELLAEGSAISNHRQPRHLTSKLCFKFGLCGGGYNQGHGGYQGGPQGGYGGYGGYGGNGGYGGYPPINIGISQSQSSASAGGGGYGSGYFPNNYQYNNGYGGYNRPGTFGNGLGSYNSQFNGNYYGGRPQGGYGFQGPYGNFYDDGQGDEKPIYEDQDDDYRSTKSKD